MYCKNEEIVGKFYQKEFKKNHTKFRLEKLRQDMLIYMSNGKAVINHSKVGSIKKNLYLK